MGRRIIEKLKAVEDLDGATLLHSDDAAIDPRGDRRNDAVSAITRDAVVRSKGWVHLRFDSGVVVGDVDDYQRV